MGGIDVGGGGKGKRNLNSEINMIPFIDLLLVTIAFLLITAVWVTFSRMNANAQIPGPPNDDVVEPTTPEKILHLHIHETEFSLIWKQGATVVSETKVPKPASKGDEIIKYEELASNIGQLAPVAAQTRTPLEDMFAAVAALTLLEHVAQVPVLPPRRLEVECKILHV